MSIYICNFCVYILGEMNWYYKAIQFDRGGHLLQKTQIPEITRQIVQLIQQTRN